MAAKKEGFWKRVEDELKSMFGSTKWETTASGALLYFGPALELVVGLAAGGPAETLVTGIVTKIQGALGAVSAVVKGAAVVGGVTPTDLAIAVAALNSVKANITQLLSAAEIKNAPRGAEITDAVNGIVGEVDAFVANLPAPVVATA
jgi:hypothetical protein